jgi:hypothetical protein
VFRTSGLAILTTAALLLLGSLPRADSEDDEQLQRILEQTSQQLQKAGVASAELLRDRRTIQAAYPRIKEQLRAKGWNNDEVLKATSSAWMVLRHPGRNVDDETKRFREEFAVQTDPSRENPVVAVTNLYVDLTVTSEPDMAEVTLSGIPCGKTEKSPPGKALMLFDTPGPHPIIIEKQGFQRVCDTVTLRGQHNKYAVTLKPASP